MVSVFETVRAVTAIEVRFFAMITTKRTGQSCPNKFTQSIQAMHSLDSLCKDVWTVNGWPKPRMRGCFDPVGHRISPESIDSYLAVDIQYASPNNLVFRLVMV